MLHYRAFLAVSDIVLIISELNWPHQWCKPVSRYFLALNFDLSVNKSSFLFPLIVVLSKFIAMGSSKELILLEMLAYLLEGNFILIQGLNLKNLPVFIGEYKQSLFMKLL